MFLDEPTDQVTALHVLHDHVQVRVVLEAIEQLQPKDCEQRLRQARPLGSNVKHLLLFQHVSFAHALHGVMAPRVVVGAVALELRVAVLLLLLAALLVVLLFLRLLFDK